MLSYLLPKIKISFIFWKLLQIYRWEVIKIKNTYMFQNISYW